MSKYTNHMELGENSSSAKVMNFITPDSTVLEFGPSSGRMTRYMKEILGCRVYIVEIDKNDYKQASVWADGGLNSNIETLEWLDAFGDIRFDYILFADVLEHLRNAEKILQAAAVLLKEDGSVVVSLPNVAHNDVILSLMDDSFHYTQVGLLDNSHVRFFGKHDLKAFFSDAGYEIIQEDAVYIPTFSTEQNLVQTRMSAQIYKEYLKSRRYGEVYQFILKLKKKETKLSENNRTSQHTFSSVKNSYKTKSFSLSFWRKKQGNRVQYIPELPDKQCNEMRSMIYYDTGRGYNENETRLARITLADNGSFSVRINLFKTVKRIRFDPSECAYVLLRNVKAYSEAEDLVIMPLNGRYIQDYIVFTNYDPQFEVRINSPVSWVEISGQISFTTDHMWKSFIDLLTDSGEGVSTSEKAQCFYDAGNGFCEKDVVIADPERQLDGRTKYVFCFPCKVYTVRFDPVEGSGCLVSDFEIAGEKGPYQRISNGIDTAIGTLITDFDPQFRLDFRDGVETLTIYAKITRLYRKV